MTYRAARRPSRRRASILAALACLAPAFLALAVAPRAEAGSSAIGQYHFYNARRAGESVTCRWSGSRLTALQVKQPSAGMNPKYVKLRYRSQWVRSYMYVEVPIKGSWRPIKNWPRKTLLRSTRPARLAGETMLTVTASDVARYDGFRVVQEIDWYDPSHKNRFDGAAVSRTTQYLDAGHWRSYCEAPPRPVSGLSAYSKPYGIWLNWQAPSALNAASVVARYVQGTTPPASPTSGIALRNVTRTSASTPADPGTTYSVSVWTRSPAGRYSQRRSVVVTTDPLTPVTATGVSNARSLGAGTDQTCAVDSNSNLLCWGGNVAGEVGDGTTTKRTRAVIVATGVDSVQGGGLTTCYISQTSLLYCWGRNDRGQVGDNSTRQRTRPVNVALNQVTGVSVGATHTCAVTASRVNCWGANTNGELGDGSRTDRPTPSLVSNSFNGVPVQVAVGFDHTCAVTNLHAVYCWGLNTRGQLGSTGVSSSTTPRLVDGGMQATRVIAGDGYSCALLVSGGVYCWGANDSDGELGDGTTTSRAMPGPVSGITNAVAISGVDYHACALLATGGVQCWGANESGQLGNGTVSRTLVPVQADIPAARTIAAGDAHSCATLNDMTVRCWGNDDAGQLGDG